MQKRLDSHKMGPTTQDAWHNHANKMLTVYNCTLNIESRIGTKYKIKRLLTTVRIRYMPVAFHNNNNINNSNKKNNKTIVYVHAWLFGSR